MKWMLLAASAVIAAGLGLPSQAAQPAAPNETQAAALPAAADDPITFEQYRDWRLRFIERRQTQLTAQLAAADLQPRQRARLEQAKAYYDWFAGLPEADRDTAASRRASTRSTPIMTARSIMPSAPLGTTSRARFTAATAPPPSPPRRTSRAEAIQ